MSDSSRLSLLFAGVNITLFILAVISVSLRCYVRIGILRAFGSDDYWMVAALASYTANTTVALLLAKHGQGRHIWDLSHHDIVQGLKFTYASELTYGATMILSKISIASFLLRIMPNRYHRRAIYFVTGLAVIAGLALFFIVFLQCIPLSRAWDKSLGGSCINVDVIIISTYVYSAFAVLTDLTLTILPIHLIWNLQSDRKTKIALAPVMCLAFLASLAVVVRLPHVKDFTDEDFLYATTYFAIWSAVEQGLAITAGSLPTVRPLLGIIFTTLKKLGRTSRNPLKQAKNQRINSNDEAAGEGYGIWRVHERASNIGRHDDLPLSSLTLTGAKDGRER